MTVELAQKAGVLEIVGRTVNELEDEGEPYRRIVRTGSVGGGTWVVPVCVLG
jgi:hypothetical protein